MNKIDNYNEENTNKCDLSRLKLVEEITKENKLVLYRQHFFSINDTSEIQRQAAI